MDQFKKIEYQRGTNPVRVFNEKFNPLDICKGNKHFEPIPGSKDIQTKTGDLAFEFLDNVYDCIIDDMGWDAGEVYTPFQLLTLIKHKDNYRAALIFVEMEYMHKECPYIRVGTKYFKRITKKNQWGAKCKELKVWTKDAITDDHGKKFLKICHQYDDFTIEPNNKNYQDSVNGMWNLYEPFPHTPHPEPVNINDIPTTANFMSHVFGEQVELGWQYMKVLYERPKQILPVLVLISKERETGKTSFLNWLDIIFANNYTVIPPEDLHSAFNSQYAYKNIIGVDEAVVDKKQAVEKIKSVATAKSILVNEKMIAQYTIPFYGKIVMTTNKESDFMRLDREEIRFWVRKLDVIPPEKMTENFYDELINEVPKFLRYLQDKISVEYGRSRMVFTYKELHNKYIEKVKKESRSGLHKEIEMKVYDWFIENQNKDTLLLRIKDIKDNWFGNNNNISNHYIKKVLNEELKMQHLPMGRYKILDGFDKIPAEPYEFNKENFIPKDGDSSDPIYKDDLPF